MPLFPEPDLPKVLGIVELVYCNPFLPERIEHERTVLGDAFDERTAEWNRRPDWVGEPPNVLRLAAHAEELAEGARSRMVEGGPVSDADRERYESLVLFVLYQRSFAALDAAAQASVQGVEPAPDAGWQGFHESARHFFAVPGVSLGLKDIAHLFACVFQVRRAFRNVFDWIVGVSEPAVRLRAAVWQSIFTHDMRRYRRSLFDRMGEYMTLITGPSGTGKDLVARAVGLSRYIPFDTSKQAFIGTAQSSFHPLNLGAMSPTLIESELFGHIRGAFTGAVRDHKGWLEVCPPHGSVFLDEVGEIDAAIQVKLLRVLEDRTFSRVGETGPRRFRGKIVAATNRDLAAAMRDGLFREDFFYRLCSDIIRAPSLRERFENEEERRHLIEFLSHRLVGEAYDDVADQVEDWIDNHLGSDYPWPGNVRELDQCVRNIVVRREYHPATLTDDADEDPYAALSDAMRAHDLTADELVRRYCALVYRATGTYEATARKLALDRRTVKAKIRP